MDNGDLQQLYEYIGTNHNATMTAIASLGQNFSEHKGNIEARVDTIEKEQETTSKRQWLHTAVIIPALAGVHGLLSYLGYRV